MEIYKALLLLFVCTTFTIAQKKFPIGAIFESEKDYAQIAFRTAVDRANVYGRQIELVPIVVYANTDDSFIVEKVACNLISQGVIAIFGPSTGSSTDVIASICNTLEIPHIIFDWRQNEALEDRPHSTMTLNVYPDTQLLAGGLADIIVDFTWRSFTVAYESEKELQQLQTVLQVVTPVNNRISVVQLDEGPDFRPFLKNIKVSSDNCLVLLCSVEKIAPILRQANDLKMLTAYQSIFFALLDTHTIDWNEFKDIAANITTVRLMDPTDFQVKNVAHDWEEREQRENRQYYRVPPDQVKTNMILANDAVQMFFKGLIDLNITDELDPPTIECKRNKPWPFGRRIIEFLRKHPIEAATGQIEFNEHGERSFFTLRLMEFTPTGFVDLATWDPLNKLSVLIDESESEDRVAKKFANKTLIVTSRRGAPFLMDREPKDGEILEGNARYEGYSLDLIDAVFRLLNLKYEFQIAPDNNYGKYDPATKEWNGLIKQLLLGNADIGICDLTMTSARRQVVDFTPPFMTLGISILYARPEVPDPDLFSFLSPFSFEVWMYMATAYLGVSFLIYGISRMAPEDWENPHPCKEPDELENVWILMNTTWLTMGSLMGQGCDLLPKAASTRLVTGMWWFFALMMLNSYTANLAAFLTMSRMGSSIHNAEELAAQTKIKYGALKDGTTAGFFKESNYSTYQRMWSAMESNPSVFTGSNDEGIDRVIKEKGNYAFLIESTILEYTIERNCTVMQVGGWLDYKTYGIAMPFNSPYRKQISGAILKLGESGTLAQLKRKWWKEIRGGNCSQETSEGSDTPELKLDNVGGVFLVLGIGLFCAILIGLSEFLWNVKAVAIDEKISLKEALKLELDFAVKFWITTKPARASSSKSSSSSNSSSSSIRTKRSSKTLAISRSHSPKSVRSLPLSEHLNVHQKLRKISSMFSIKSLRFERDQDVELENAGSVKGEQLSKDKNGFNQKESKNSTKNSSQQKHRPPRELSANYNAGSEPFA